MTWVQLVPVVLVQMYIYLSRLNYGNSVLADLPKCTIAPLQRAQYASARLVLDLKMRDHVTTTLLQLASCPPVCGIQTVNHDALHKQCLTCLADGVHATADNPTRPVRWRLRYTRSLDVAAHSENGHAVMPAHSHGTPYHQLFITFLTGNISEDNLKQIF